MNLQRVLAVKSVWLRCVQYKKCEIYRNVYSLTRLFEQCVLVNYTETTNMIVDSDVFACSHLFEHVSICAHIHTCDGWRFSNSVRQ